MVKDQSRQSVLTTKGRQTLRFETGQYSADSVSTGAGRPQPFSEGRRPLQGWVRTTQCQPLHIGWSGSTHQPDLLDVYASVPLRVPTTTDEVTGSGR